MVFVGKLACLVLFPGVVFITAAGYAALAVTSGIGAAVAPGGRSGSSRNLATTLGHARSECIATGGSLHAAMWISPVFKLLALGWVSCVVCGFLPGDVVLVFALMLAAAGSDVLFAYVSENPRVRQSAWPEAASLLAWAVPMALVTACVGLLTHQAEIKGVISWQTANGTPLASGAPTAIAGAWLALLAAIAATGAVARLRPLGRSCMEGTGAILDDVSGPPLAFFLAGNQAMLFVATLVLVAFFFAGPASNWYQVVFWALKVIGVLVLLGLLDVLAPRMRSGRALLW